MAGGLARIDRVCAAISRRIAFIGIAGMLAVSLLTCVDVLLRWLFNAPIDGFFEIVAVVMAVAVAATMVGGAASRVHIDVDLLGGLYGERVVAWMKAAGAFLLLGMMIYVSWRLWIYASQLDARNTMMMVRPWPVAPFLWTTAALIAAGALVQFVVLVDALHTACFAGAATAARNRAALLLAVAALAALAAAEYGFQPGIAALRNVAPGDAGAIALAGFAVLWLLILVFVPIAPAMGIVGFVGGAIAVGYEPALNFIGSESAAYLTNPNLAVLPLFLMMGSFASVGGLSDDIYRLAQALFGHMRGGLALATIGGCAGFGALTGSSLATAVTIGRVAIPEMQRRGYSAGLATGCVAAGGTLGQIVPPSAVLIIYAILTEESIGRLFIAAVVPAIIATVLYLLTVSIVVKLRPAAAPPAGRASLRELAAAARRCTLVLCLLAIVIGGIYGGIFTVNEAAAVGAGFAFAIALFRGRLGGGAFWRVMGETTSSTAMIYLLIIGASLFSFFFGAIGVTDELTETVRSLGLPPLGVITILLLVFLAFGAVMDSFAILVITVPIVTPLVVDLGYDPLWWGIIMVMVVETGLITPPFGINVFALKAVAPDIPMRTVFAGVLPFVGADIIRLAIVTLFPILSLWLPSTMIQ